MESTPRLATLQWIVALYAKAKITERQLRAWIRAGRLPATKVGRSYLVSEADVAALLAPRLRSPTPKLGKRESETARIGRQLRGAGIQ